MRWAAPLAALALSVLVGALPGARAEAARVVACEPGTQALARSDGGKRCVDLPERIRLALEVRGGASVERVAARHRLRPRAVASVAADPRNRLLTDGPSATPRGAEPGCDLGDGRARVDLRWEPVGKGRQVVAVALSERAIRQGTFRAGPALGATVGEATWRRTEGQAPHVWTVLTETAAGWGIGGLGRFDGPLCAVDYQGQQG
jgi:hypothetical protein